MNISARLGLALRRKPTDSNARKSRAKSESEAVATANGSAGGSQTNGVAVQQQQQQQQQQHQKQNTAPARKSISYKIPTEDFEYYYDDMAGLGLNAKLPERRDRNVGSIGSRASIDAASVRTRASIDSGFSKATTLAERKGSRGAERQHADLLHNLADFEPEDEDDEEEEEEEGHEVGRRRGSAAPRKTSKTTTTTVQEQEVSEEPFLPDTLAFNPDLVAARERMLLSLSPSLWSHILSFASLSDTCNLALSSKSLYNLLGPSPWQTLNLPANKPQKSLVLLHTDALYPNHLLCFPCGTYHLRSKRGSERLDTNYVLNPLFTCPNVRTTVLPRMRLTHGRELPFAFAQLAMRAHRLGPSYGIPWRELARVWRCRDSGWSHATQFYVHKGHLLFKCVSSSVAPRAHMTQSEERLFLYSRGDYTPYFSVCAHWRDGLLTSLCKCALSHIPAPRQSLTSQLKKSPKVSLAAARTNYIVRLCEECKPMRRCPRCPTEYLITVKMVEDKSDAVNTFKHAITVTRWSDLGDATSPYTPEWAACTGASQTPSPISQPPTSQTLPPPSYSTTSTSSPSALPHPRTLGEAFHLLAQSSNTETLERAQELSDAEKMLSYDSFAQIGRRTLAGTFESSTSNTPPGERVLSLNPKGTVRGEEGDGWY